MEVHIRNASLNKQLLKQLVQVTGIEVAAAQISKNKIAVFPILTYYKEEAWEEHDFATAQP